jgi:prepilin peptidase CpaA
MSIEPGHSAVWVTWAAWVALLALIVTACAVDLRERRIPNVVCVAGLLAGLLLQATLPLDGTFAAIGPGAIGLAAAGAGALAMLGAGLLLWRVRLFGAGDAKLLVAVGAYVGIAGAPYVLVLTALFGGALAISTGLLVHRTLSLDGRTASLRVPYSLAIGAGTLAHAAAASFGLWTR